MSCHWEDTDAAIQEIFSNVRLALPFAQPHTHSPASLHPKLPLFTQLIFCSRDDLTHLLLLLDQLSLLTLGLLPPFDHMTCIASPTPRTILTAGLDDPRLRGIRRARHMICRSRRQGYASNDHTSQFKVSTYACPEISDTRLGGEEPKTRKKKPGGTQDHP